MREGVEQDAAAALRARVARWREGTERQGVDLAPWSAYEAMTRQKVEALADDLKEIKGRLNGLLWMLAGAIVLDVVLRMAGGT
jgi:hypothetical protein